MLVTVGAFVLNVCVFITSVMCCVQVWSLSEAGSRMEEGGDCTEGIACETRLLILNTWE